MGYGDRYPIGAEGRLLAIALMVAGVGMFATQSGVLASWILSPTRAKRQDEIAALRQELAEVRQLLAAIQRDGNPSQ